MIFDQFSRYKACSELLLQAGFTSESRVLDVGSGPECLLGNFLPETDITFIDPLIENNIELKRIKGTVFDKNLDGQRFDYVTAVDVFEHVPPNNRTPFLERLSSLCTKTLIIGFPSSDTNDAAETDFELDSKYRNIFDHKYPWLDEHYRFGLPSLKETQEFLSNLGWHCKTMGHGYIPWYRELLGFVICALTEPGLVKIVDEISDKFNYELFPFDFTPPNYRQFIIAFSNPTSTIKFPERPKIDQVANAKFQSLMKTAESRYFALALRQLHKKNKLISDLRQRHENDLFTLNKEIELNTKKINDLEFTITESKIQNQTAILNIQQKLSEKHNELMKMSDWASSMSKELNALNSTFYIRLRRFISHRLRKIKLINRKTRTGRIIKFLSDKKRIIESSVNIDILRKSVIEKNGKLIVVFPIITWEFRWQRPQHIITRLRDNGYAILYLAMTLSAKNRRFKSLAEAGANVRFNTLDYHIHQAWLHCANKINIYTDSISGDDLFNIAAGLQETIDQLDVKEIIYLIQHPGWGPVALKIKQELGGKIVFDCMDEHCGFDSNSAEALESEEILIKKADLVITSSDILEKKAKKLNPSTIQAKNGTEFGHFSDPEPNGELDYLRGKPIIGYYGAISDWFDMEIIAYCAKQRPQWTFVLIGATFGADLERVADITNVHLLGEKGYQYLPGYLAYFDVCTIPFKITPLTLATNPVKFYEYLSAGKPVVSTALPELIPFKNICYLANDKDDFLLKLESALLEKNDREKIKQRILCAKNNSWDHRVSEILGTECFLTNNCLIS